MRLPPPDSSLPGPGSQHSPAAGLPARGAEPSPVHSCVPACVLTYECVLTCTQGSTHFRGEAAGVQGLDGARAVSGGAVPPRSVLGQVGQRPQEEPAAQEWGPGVGWGGETGTLFLTYFISCFNTFECLETKSCEVPVRASGFPGVEPSQAAHPGGPVSGSAH